MKNLNAFLGDAGRVVTDYGVTTLRVGETAQEAARRRYRGWQAGWDFEGCVKPYHWLGVEADYPKNFQRIS